MVKREPCPSCRAKGNDKSGNNLNVFDNGSKHCYACNYHVKPDGSHEYVAVLPPHRPMPETGIQSRHIEQKVCNKYGVVNATLDATELTEDGHVFKRSSKVIYPYHNIENGKLIGFKQIDYSVPKGEYGRFLWFGDSSQCTVFGANIISSNAQYVVLCEGENDTLAAAQLLGVDYTCIGISGTGMTERIKRILSVLRKYKRVYVCMDNDEAGRAATQQLLDILPAGKTYIINLPSDINDVNDMVMSGRSGEFIRCVRDAKQVLPKGIVNKDDIKSRLDDYLKKRGQLKGVPSGIPALDYACGGLVPGKLITFAGGTGCGKSTIAENIAVNLALSGQHTFILSLEMPDIQVAGRMVQTILREPIASDPNYDISQIAPEVYDNAVNTILDHVHFYDHMGGLSVDSVIDVMNYAVDVYDVNLIILDNYTSASDTLEWKDLEKLAQRVKNEVAIARNTCVVAISHISRDGNNEEEIPHLKHLRGGNGVAQQSDIVIGVGRKRDSKIINCRTIKTDRMTGRFVEFDLEYNSYKLTQVGFSDIPTVNDEYEPDEDNEAGYSLAHVSSIYWNDPKHPLNTRKHGDNNGNSTTDSSTVETRQVSQTTGDDTGRAYDSIPEWFRAESTRVDGLSVGLREADVNLHECEEVQTRLSTSERDNYRSEGTVQPRRQTKDESYKGGVPHTRYTHSLSAWSWETTNVCDPSE